MELSERLARKLCKLHNIDPDIESVAIYPNSKAAEWFGPEVKYKLWQYWEKAYVLPILEEVGNE